MTNRIQDLNGWFEIKNNPISKEGVFPYLGKSIDNDGSMGLEPDTIYNVYRPKAELSDPECLDSFKLVPWINEHEMLGKDLTPAEKKGIEGVIGEDVYFDESDGTLKANIKIFSESLKESIECGKDELSCGYRCKYRLSRSNFKGDNYSIVQESIRGNHLALVDKGRMGPDVAVLDKVLSFAVDAKEIVIMSDEKTKADDMENEEVKDEGKELEEKDEEKEKEKSTDTSEEKKQGEGQDVSELIAENKAMKADIAKLQDTIDSFAKDGLKELMSAISKRDSLANKLSRHVGAFDSTDMSAKDVAKYGVKKLSIECEDGQEIAALTGYMHNRVYATEATATDKSEGSKIGAIDKYISGAA